MIRSQKTGYILRYGISIMNIGYNFSSEIIMGIILSQTID
jgi:hypothetical protein